MLSSTTASTHMLFTPCSLAASTSSQTFPSSLLFVVRPTFHFRRTQERWFVPLSFLGGCGGGGRERRCALLGLYGCSRLAREFERGLHWGWSGFVRRCRDWDGEGDFALEAEILEFMKSSERPEAFPSRKELVDAGRMDLAEAIVKRGGWLSMGWDLDEERGSREDEDFGSGSVTAMEFDDFRMNSDWTGQEEGTQGSPPVVSSCPYDYSHSTSSSGGSLEIANASSGHETGIEGILSRLEKERSLAFGLGGVENEDTTFSASDNEKDDCHSEFPADATVGSFSGSTKSSSLSPKKAIFDESGDAVNQHQPFSHVDSLRNSHEPETWKAWSTGFSDINSEGNSICLCLVWQLHGYTVWFKWPLLVDAVIDISSSDISMEGSVDIPKDEKLRRASDDASNERDEIGLSYELIDHNPLRSRLQHLELELSSALQAVRSNADEIATQKDHEGSSDNLLVLSDALEFQENEIMNSQDKLRSIRAKLAVLEGKMALAIIDAQKIVEEKQKRIDDARRALRLLRHTCIVWPNSASEVLLAGSFDGWASKRKMEKSNTGIFSLWLQLYPGRYEIKFIVDGEWGVDPLRPIVTNNGHQNNLLIIT